METLTHRPDWNYEVTSTPRAEELDFGDNYSQVFVRGINRCPKTIKIVFANRRTAVAADLEAFFERHGGAAAFLFKAEEDDPLKKYRTTGPFTRVKVGFNRETVTATLREVP